MAFEENGERIEDAKVRLSPSPSSSLRR